MPTLPPLIKWFMKHIFTGAFEAEILSIFGKQTTMQFSDVDAVLRNIQDWAEEYNIKYYTISVDEDGCTVTTKDPKRRLTFRELVPDDK